LRLVITLASPIEAKLSVIAATDQPSTTLEGGSLLFADGSRLPFSGSEMRLPLARLAQGFAVIEPGGALLSLRD
jgi:hypothetical protein